MDGSTDVANIDDELFLVLWCDVDGSDEKVHTRMTFFAVARPEEVTGKGLFDCMQGALGDWALQQLIQKHASFWLVLGQMEQVPTLVQLV